MACYVRPMRREDITQVTEIDREAFPAEWPPANYKYELQNHLAHYLVACDDTKTMAKPEAKAPPEKGWAGLTFRLKRWFPRDSEQPSQPEHYIVGFAGFWIMAGEAHIISIAVREAYRRQGIGELLLISATDLAMKLMAHIVTLEVRVSNVAAQRLYAKYGFVQVGMRRGYYLDNREDALVMSTQQINSATFQAHFQRLKQAHLIRLGLVPARIAG